jgi:NlpC/P60 family
VAALNGQELLNFLMQFVGQRYVWGGQAPGGFDCSGLMWYGAQHFGLSIPRTSNAQIAALRSIPIQQAQIGDLVFFDSDNNGHSDHVGMYAGNGQVLVADNPSQPIHVVSVSTEARITGVGRIPGIVNTNVFDGGLTHAGASGFSGVNGADFSALLPSARPTYDLFGSLGLQSPNSSLLNENYGLAASFMESDPELANIYSQAVAGTWSTDKFQAAVQNTDWWKANSDSARKMLEMKYSDPAQYKQDMQNKTLELTDLASKLGVHLSATGMSSLADLALVTNMNDAQINGYLSKYLELSKQGHFSGYAGQVELGVREYAREMGVPLTDDYVERAVSGIVAGTDSLQARRANIQTIAQQTFPAYAKEINDGMTVGQIAAPYLAAQSKLWEVDPNKIDLFDPTLRGALQQTTAQDKDTIPSQMPLYDFEKQLRSNAKWLSTNNARESMSATANQVLSDMGLTAQSLGAAPQTSPQQVTDNSRANMGGLSGSSNFPTLQGQQANQQTPTQAPQASSLAPDTSFQAV